MITINYEFKVPPSGPLMQMPDGQMVCVSTIAWYTEFRRVCGETGEEIKAKAAEMAKDFHAIEYMAVGLHNLKADWEAAFGAPDNPLAANYLDTWKPLPPPSRGDWKSWLHKFNPFGMRS